ncbi:hypothetical protein KAR91_64890, partial [Candidatus Pacearchaeota archaeon]|nr:hypothetical protein [Candidatus Pacearchaeota archaeon]
RTSEEGIDRSIPTNGLLDDFNDGLDPNFWGGFIETYKSDTGGEVAYYEYDTGNDFENKGSSLKLKYSLPDYTEGQWAAFNIDVCPSGEFRNLSSFNYLYFWIRSDHENVDMKIELKNSAFDPEAENWGRTVASLFVSDYLDGGITIEWQKVKIPLEAFCNLQNGASDLIQLTFVFVQDQFNYFCDNPSADVNIDNIGFEKGSAATVLRIDHFGDTRDQCALGGAVVDMEDHSHTYDDVIYHDHPCSLRSAYDTTVITWGGIYFVFGDGDAVKNDLSAYNKISFWVRSDTPSTTPEKIKIALNTGDNASGEDNVAYIPDDADVTADISTSWQKYTIQFSEFSTGFPFVQTEIKTFAFIYEAAEVGVNKTGVVYFDEIQFEQ